MLTNKTIILGVTGGIAAYKAADLASKLTQAGAKVRVIMTKAAQQLVSPLTFESLTANPVVTDMFQANSEHRINHISLAEKADIILIGPATANVIAKIAGGLADDVLTATTLATKAPVVIAPAMHSNMWENPITQENLTRLKKRGFYIIEPAVGRLASGGYGPGRFPETEVIIGHIQKVLGKNGDLAGKRIVVTSGGTQEPIDPVRVISNRSSGKMGYSIAEAARDRGAEVTLITAPTIVAKPVGIQIISLETAGQMKEAVEKAAKKTDALIMAAAVADFQVAKVAENKIKKEKGSFTLKLVNTPDILSSVEGNFLKIGFAAESQDLIANARKKVQKKNLDLIVANDITEKDSGFGTDTNRVTLIGKEGSAENLPLLSKREVADRILDRVVRLFKEKGNIMPEKAETQFDMPKAYEPDKVEDKWYRFWMEKGYFKPKIDPHKQPFTIIMPPPNVTGELHVGHALTAALEDIMTRWHRMKGDPTLWLPGIDHSGIAAQVVVERLLAKEKTNRYLIGREEFDERMKAWASQARQSITNQHMKLGVSCDWSRECYTLDPGPSLAVRTTFKRLFEKGLIYRGERIANWCPRCSTVLSDLEVDHQDTPGHLWYIRYPLEDGKDYITVATTRPETMLGDTAVAVNPHDDRFAGWVGKKLVLPLLNRTIPIVADEAIDPAFGTGAVKVTPAHDPVDFEIAQRHQLPLINILNNDATMNENAGPYKGLDRFECRKKVVEDLEKEGLLDKIEPYSHAIGHCQRCQTLIEPIASKQWFVKMEPLAKPAMEAVKDGRIKIIPDRFTKVYLNWMENIRDWCVSRQLWWGHRIPVWYCKDCGNMIAAIQNPAFCHCGSKNIEQDKDVLDTWFSSGLWPHSTLGWPEDTQDLRYFYPTSVMETAYDIIFFWVARMIMMGIENMGEIPFHTVYLHGLVRDEKGEKMSKVKGNVLNPLVAIEDYGADALRFALSTGTSPGNDMRMAGNRLESSRNFVNKIWNASRFVIQNIEPDKAVAPVSPPAKFAAVEDRWILSRLNRTLINTTQLMENFQFGEAQRQIYDFLWSEFCDWYIEIAKIRLRDEKAVSPVPVLVYVLETSLRLLHPFMPFITEELWQTLKQRLPENSDQPESIMISAYPEGEEKFFDPEAERIIESLIEIVHSIRNTRAEHKVESNKLIEAHVYAGDLVSSLKPYYQTIQTLTQVQPLELLDIRHRGESDENKLVLILKDTEVVIPLASMVDLEAEKSRLQKELAEVKINVDRLESRLNDQAFINKAPANVVQKERDRFNEGRDKLQRLQQQVERFK